MQPLSIACLPVLKVTAAHSLESTDTLAAEEPLEIRLGYREGEQRVQKKHFRYHAHARPRL